MKSETQIKKEIVAYLDSLGSKCWHVPFHNMGYTRNGIPDRLVCYRGRFLALEVKAEGKKPTKWQERELKAIDVACGWSAVVYSALEVANLIRSVDAQIDSEWRG